MNPLPPTTDPTSPAAKRWLALLGVGLGVLMFTIDTSIVNVAMPTLVRELNTDFTTIQWVVLSYLLTVTVLVLGAARLGDMFGKKQLYLAGLILFTLSSVLCAASPTVGWLIGFRALQGIGAVFISALGAAIVTEIFPGSERGRALGIIGSIVSLGISLGPSVGGVLISLSGWRSIFWVNLPIGIISSLIVARVVPASDPMDRGKQTFDGWGALVFTVSVSCFALGMTNGQTMGFTSGIPVSLLLVAGIGLISFIGLEMRIRQPLLDLKIFTNRTFSYSLLTGYLVFIAAAGLIFLLPFFLELVKQYPTQQVGLLLAVAPVIAGVISPFAGVLSDRYGSRLIGFIGLICLTLGCVLLSTFDAELTVPGYLLRILPYGIGFGLFQSPNNSAIMGSVVRERLGIASGLLSLTRTLGQTTGLPLIGALFSGLVIGLGGLGSGANVITAPIPALISGFQISFRIEAGIILLAAVVMVLAWKQERNQALPSADRF